MEKNSNSLPPSYYDTMVIDNQKSNTNSEKNDNNEKNDKQLNPSKDINNIVGILKIFEDKLNLLQNDDLKDKCKEMNINGFSKLKKQELQKELINKYHILYTSLLNYKLTELKNICKINKISGFSDLKKEEIIYLIMTNDNTCKNMKINTEISLTDKLPNNNTNDTLEHLKNLEQQIKLKKEMVEKEIKEENERVEKERIEKEKKAEKERIEKEKKAEKERIEKEKKAEKERIDKEKKAEKERIDKEKKAEKYTEEKEQQSEDIEKKKKKQSIPKSVKCHVWELYIGKHINEHRCVCCKKTLIQNTNFDVGHVISEKDGGTHEISNLRPICSVCNHSMGTENMIEFVKKYGYYIG